MKIQKKKTKRNIDINEDWSLKRTGKGPVLTQKLDLVNSEKSGVPMKDNRSGKAGKSTGRPIKKRVGRPAKTPPSKSKTVADTEDNFHIPSFAQVHPTPQLATTFVNGGYFDFQEFLDPADNFVTFQADASFVGQDEELLPNMPEVEINAY
jgi:hypothetical protein